MTVLCIPGDDLNINIISPSPLSTVCSQSTLMSGSVSFLLLLLLLVSPGLSDHDCSCLQCGGTLEVYRGTDLLLSTSSTMTNISITTTTWGADQIYLLGCGCFMVFSGRGRYGRAQKISSPGLTRIESGVYVGSVWREENCHLLHRYPDNFRYYN